MNEPTSETGSQERSQRHRIRREKRWQRIWRLYWFEIVAALAIALGLFLLYEQLELRSSLLRGLRTGAAALFRVVTRFSGRLGGSLNQATASDVLGFLLIVAAIAAIVWRVRWRFTHSLAFTALRCPKCGSNINRKHRTTLDRILSIAVPVRRYRCVSSECRWHGLRVTPARNAVQTPAAQKAPPR